MLTLKLSRLSLLYKIIVTEEIPLYGPIISLEATVVRLLFVVSVAEILLVPHVGDSEVALKVP